MRLPCSAVQPFKHLTLARAQLHTLHFPALRSDPQ